MTWHRRHVLATDDWSRAEIEQVLETTGAMLEVLGRPIRRTPALRGRTVILFFAEASTRTRVSFELAAKALSASRHRSMAQDLIALLAERAPA